MAVQSYRAKMRLAWGLALVGALAAGLLGSQVVTFGRNGANFWLIFPALLLVCALALAACIPWWRRVDDMKKYAHMVSWYWGGIAGGSVTVVALVAAGGRQAELAQGGGIVMVGQAIGFLIFFAGWRLRYSGAAA